MSNQVWQCNSCTRPEPTTTIPGTMSTNIHVRMWTSTSNTITNNTTNRPGGLHPEPPEDSCTKPWIKHQRTAITSLLFTITGQYPTIPSHIDGTSTGPTSTGDNKLQSHLECATPNPTMDCETCSMATEQVCRSQWWANKLPKPQHHCVKWPRQYNT